MINIDLPPKWHNILVEYIRVKTEYDNLRIRFPDVEVAPFDSDATFDKIIKEAHESN